MEIVGVVVAMCGVGLGAGELVRIYLLRARSAPQRVGSTAGQTAPQVAAGGMERVHSC